MQVEEFKAKLQAVEKQGFVVSKRRGNTGIGYTLETLLGIGENNIKLPDLGEIELKSKRKNVSTFVTMFTPQQWGVENQPSRDHRPIRL